MEKFSVCERHFGCILSLGVFLGLVVWLFGCERREVFLVEGVGQPGCEALKTVLSENQTIGSF